MVFTYMLFRYNLDIRSNPQVTHRVRCILPQYIHVFCAFDRHRKFCCRLTNRTTDQRLRFKLGLTSQLMENEFNNKRWYNFERLNQSHFCNVNCEPYHLVHSVHIIAFSKDS